MNTLADVLFLVGSTLLFFGTVLSFWLKHK